MRGGKLVLMVVFAVLFMVGCLVVVVMLFPNIPAI